jgi:2-oxoisovalerate dehydrogenase E1 component
VTATDTPEQGLERNFRERVGALTRGAAADVDVDQPVRDGTRLTGRMGVAVFDAMAAAEISTSRRAICARRAPGSTRSDPPVTSRTPRSQRRSGPPTPPSCITDRAGSTARGRSRCRGQPRSRTSSSAWSQLGMNRFPAGVTRCSGNHALAVIPQTSTIASHLPRAMGVAFAIERTRRIGSPPRGQRTRLSFAHSATPH